MIEVRAFGPDGHREGIDPLDISEIVGAPGTLLWVDVTDPTDADLACLQDEFSLHPLAMEDARKHDQRPKLELYPTHAFVVAYSAGLAEVDVFVGPSWVVSVRETGAMTPWSTEGVRRRFIDSKPDQVTSGFLVYLILDDLVDGYFARLDAIEESVEVLEERIFSDEKLGEQQLQHELYRLRRDAVGFRRRIHPLAQVMEAIRRGDVEWVDDVALVHFQDVADHVQRAIESIERERELLGNAVDAHLAIMSNRMNMVMKKMTSWGAILLGSTLVAGIYGMNFRHMPELHWTYGYQFALGIMAVITVVGYTLFKRRDWL